mgnify:CR=1 FL=1
MRPVALPDFPWDSLAGPAATARSHPGGLVDLSVGTPVDPTPDLVQRELVAAANAPGYPTTHGTPALRQAVVEWFARRRGVPGLDPEAVLPTVGSKELVALLPSLLGIGAGDVVVHPRIAYPTYDVGARLAGATPVAADAADVPVLGSEEVSLIWVNSPANPTGAVLDVEQLSRLVSWARERGAVVASDECYAELVWGDDPAPSILDPRVNGGSAEGLLALYSLSKQSNLAGYRAAFAAGDPALIARLLQVRKHAGLIMPEPVQAAMTAALGDDRHVAAQRERYRSRRALLQGSLSSAGLVHDGGDAGLYLWVRASDRPGTTSAELVDALAARGILVAPGTFYGEAGDGFVRVALTASDERVGAARERLSQGSLFA